MTNKKLYRVSSQIEVDGQLVQAGADVELTDDQAAYPLSRGAVELVPAAESAPARPRASKAGGPSSALDSVEA